MHTKTLPKPVFLFDDDCGLCQKATSLIRVRVNPPADIVSYQSFDYKSFGITRSELDEGPVFIDTNGVYTVGPLGMAQMLSISKAPFHLIGSFMLLPGVSHLLKKIGPFMYSKKSYLPGATAGCSIEKR